MPLDMFPVWAPGKSWWHRFIGYQIPGIEFGRRRHGTRGVPEYLNSMLNWLFK